MHRLHGCAGSFRLFTVAERNQVKRLQRAGKAAPEIVVVCGMLDDAASDERLGHLKEHAAPPPRNGVTGEFPSRRTMLSGLK